MAVPISARKTIKYGKTKVKEDLFQNGQREEANEIQSPARGSDRDKLQGRVPRRNYQKTFELSAPQEKTETERDLTEYIASTFSAIRKTRR